MSFFYGTHENRLDQQGRVVIPSAFRQAPREVLQHLFVLPVDESYLEVLPAEEWKRQLAEIENSSKLTLGQKKFMKEHKIENVQTAKVDNQNRLALSHRNRAVLGIEEASSDVELVFQGAGEYFKIKHQVSESEQAKEQREYKRLEKLMLSEIAGGGGGNE